MGWEWDLGMGWDYDKWDGIGWDGMGWDLIWVASIAATVSVQSCGPTLDSYAVG